VVVFSDQTAKNTPKIPTNRPCMRIEIAIFVELTTFYVDISTKYPISSRIFSIVSAENPLKTTTGSYGF
jgi:23S rRNA G2445 N2-methylase RlmL